MNSFVFDSINPHIFCLSEQDILNLTLSGYSLGYIYCCQNLQKGGGCILVREDQSFRKTDTSLHYAEWTLEACAIELETKSSTLRILTLYRAPSANLNQFIERLDATPKYLYNQKSEFLICGDINVDYPMITIRKNKLIINNI
jgi:exonuclease III